MDMLGIDPRAARATWTVILIALLCLVIYSIRNTFFIFIVSLLFAYLLAPIVDFIDRVLPLKRSRTPALAIVYLVLVTGIVLAGISIGAKVAYQANNLAQRITDFLKPERTETLPLPEPVKPAGPEMVARRSTPNSMNPTRFGSIATATCFGSSASITSCAG